MNIMRPDWDDQFAETEDERNERLRRKRLKKAAPYGKWQQQRDDKK